jgi:hypothetical protein
MPTSVLTRGRLFEHTFPTSRGEGMTPPRSRSGTRRRSQRNALSVKQGASSRPSQTPIPV